MDSFWLAGKYFKLSFFYKEPFSSNTGIVNVYDMNDYKWLNKRQNSSQRPLLFATFDQLTTSVSWLEFSKDAQLLAMGSTVKVFLFSLKKY